MFSLCVNPPSASDAPSPSLRQASLPRLLRDALRWRHHSIRRTLRDFVFRRPRPAPPPNSLYAYRGVFLASTKRPSTHSLYPNPPKSAYVETSYSDASHAYPRSQSSSATSLSLCTDRGDAQCAPAPSRPPSCAAAAAPDSVAPECAMPPLDERWLLCSTHSFPTDVSAESLSDRASYSVSSSQRSPRSVLRRFSKLPDVRDAGAAPFSAVTEHSERPSDAPQRALDHDVSYAHGASPEREPSPKREPSVPPECAEQRSPPPSEEEMPVCEPPAEADDDELNITVPIVPAFPEDRVETRSNSISLFGMYAPAGLPHGEHQTQANAYAVLAAYAENAQEEEEALCDMDISAVDDTQPPQAQPDAQLPVMRMDAETCKWVGNEQEFAHFDNIVAALRNEPEPEPEPPQRDAVFDVDEDLMQQWRDDCEQHNRQFANGFQDNGAADIRDMIGFFAEAQASSSQQEEQ